MIRARAARITLRTKLLFVVGTGLVALSAIVVGSALIDLRRARDLTDLEGRLVPRLELGPRLESEFERLGQGMQDAVAAEDRAALDAVAQTKDRLFVLIGGTGALTAAEAASLRWAIQEYYEAAGGVSRRLIDGETGEAIVADIAGMQARRARALALVQQTTRLDKRDLASAFAAIRGEAQRANQFRLAMGFGGLGLLIVLSLWVSRGALRVLGDLSKGFTRFGAGDLAHEIPVTTADELGDVAREANEMAARLRALAAQRDRADWLKGGQAGLSDELRGDLEPAELARRALWFIARHLRACAGAFYLKGDDGLLALASHYAMGSGATDDASSEPGARPVAAFRVGESLVGQAAASGDLLIVDEPPADYLRVRSGLGEAAPRALVLVPLSHLGEATGVLELALFEPCSEEVRQLLLAVRQTLVVSLEAAKSRAALRVLLERTQSQAERLAAQEEELRLNNQELHAQQSGLRSANEELEAQRAALSTKNRELEEARRRVQEKADELARVSTYKSQFLANMSHELRTPLNSMLLLSHLLSQNEAGNLTQKQVEHCRTIHAAGEDLLTLINQVLDLAKIEAGRQEVVLEGVEFQALVAHARRVFDPLASERGLRLVLEIAPGMPSRMVTDRERIERIVTNLLGNAIKFTESGEVSLRIGRPAPGTRFRRSDLSVDRTVAFSVSDTGIGIAPDAQERIFAPFEQIEAHTKRRYGGTGLGLAISRDSANLLGGELQVVSEPGRGSTFTCYLPERSEEEGADGVAARAPRARTPIPDDRASLASGETHLLVVEDDPVLAEQLMDIIHARGFKAVVATTGEEGLRAARERRPKGIILDVKLPDVDGWTVMERLTQDPSTRAIPVHFISAVHSPERGLSLGAIGYLTKPATHAELAAMVRALTPAPGSGSPRVLVVEDSPHEGESIMALLAREQIEAHHVGSAGEAMTALAAGPYGCMVLDLGLPDTDGLGLLEALRQRSDIAMPRIIVHTGRSLTKKETRELEAYAEAVILKDGRSDERLLEEMRLFVRHLRESLPRERPSESAMRSGPEVSLAGVKILLAEDDMRTVYALSALLRGKGAEVLVAETGREALAVLDGHPELHGVLMDIMMPEMDGYEAMRRLRQDPRFRAVPIIALTAKAMKGERERCLEAGANEYLTKPIDGERLLSTLATWLLPGGSNGS